MERGKIMEKLAQKVTGRTRHLPMVSMVLPVTTFNDVWGPALENYKDVRVSQYQTIVSAFFHFSKQFLLAIAGSSMIREDMILPPSFFFSPSKK